MKIEIMKILALIEEIKEKANKNNFAQLAKEYSNDAKLAINAGEWVW